MKKYITGNSTDFQKQKILEIFETRFANNTREMKNNFPEYLVNEINKTLKELEIINLVNQELENIHLVLGIPFREISSENYRIVPDETYQRLGPVNSMGVAFFAKQFILMNEKYARLSLLDFALLAFHESMHLCGFHKLQVTALDPNQVSSVKVIPLREGIAVYKPYPKKQTVLFSGLHEAIVTLSEINFYHKIKKLDLFEGTFLKKEFAYHNPRNILMYVIGEIEKDINMSYEQIFNLFLAAHLGGNIMSVCRLIVNSFSTAGLYMLASMDTDDDSCVEIIYKLIGLRKNKN